MTGIVGCICKQGKIDTSKTTDAMAQKLSHRGKYISKYSPDIYDGPEETSIIIVNHTPVAEFKSSKETDVLLIVDSIAATNALTEEMDIVLKKHDDVDSILWTNHVFKNLLATNVAIFSKSGLILTRSIDGQKPLYISKSREGIFFATERKGLWSIGLNEIEPFVPGSSMFITYTGDVKKTVTAARPIIERISKRDTILELRKYLESSFSYLEGISKCGILFSGGVDSSLVAHLAKRVMKEPYLFTTCTETSHDRKATRDASEILNMELVEVLLDSEVLWQTLPSVIYAIETTNRMDVEIALPFFLAAQEAKEQGITLMLSGQGPDELFGGYAKHVDLFIEHGSKALDVELAREVTITHEANIARDEKAVAFNGIEAYFPFLENHFVNLALSTTSEWKINPGGIPERKVLFRELATDMGLPKKLVNVPKRATQYSSGTSKLLRKSMIQNVESFKTMTRKLVSMKIQTVLDMMGLELGIPISTEGDTVSGINMEFVEAFRKREN